MDGSVPEDDAGTDAGMQVDAAVPLTFASVMPTSGAAAGGTPVVILGTGFTDGTTVAFGEALGTDTQVVSGEAIQTTTPPGEIGPVSLTITRPDGESVDVPDAFEYVDTSACRVTSSTPASASNDVSLLVAPSVTLGRNLDPASITGVKLHTADGVDVPVVVSLGADQRSLTVQPTGRLHFAETYVLEVSGLQTSAAATCEGAAISFSTVVPEQVAQPDFAAAAFRLATSGTHLYSASRKYRGLQIFDVSAAQPSLVGKLMTDARPLDVAVHGSRAYLAVGTSGVLVADVSNPTQPTLLGSFDTPGTANAVRAFEADGHEVLAVADGAEGLRLLDVTNPQAITTLASVEPSGVHDSDARTLALSDDGVLVLANGKRGISWIDVTAPAAPVLVATTVPDPLPTGLATRNVVGVERDGTLTFALLDGAFRVYSYDTTTPAAPAKISEATACSGTCIQRASTLRREGSSLFLATILGGLVELPYDVTGVLGTKIVRSTALGPVNDVAVIGTVLYAATDVGPAVFDRAGTADARWFDATAQGNATGVAHLGDTLFLSSATRGLIEFGVGQNPERPTMGAVFTTPGIVSASGVAAQRVVAQGSLVAVGDGRSGLALFTHGQNGTTASGSLAAADRGSYGLLAGDTAYLCNDRAGFYIIDVRTPAAPVMLSSTTFQALDAAVPAQGCRGLDLVGNTLFVASDLGLWTVDVTNKAAPALIGHALLTGSTITNGFSQVVVQESVALVLGRVEAASSAAGFTSHLFAYDVTNLAAPMRIWTSDDLGGVSDAEAAGSLLFVGGLDSGLHIFDISAPTHPVPEAHVPVSGTIADVHVAGDALYLAMSAGGLGVIHTGPLPVVDGPVAH